MARQGTSFARIIVTPIIVLVAGYLVAGINGLAIGAVISIVYIIVASRRGTKMAAGSATDDLAKLAALRDSGAVTSEEFEAKKAELLRRV